MKKESPIKYEPCIAIIVCTAISFIIKPYTGIRHDSILYLGQALYNNHPDIFSKDIFFEFGSQASFTVFPQIVGSLLKAVPPDGLFLWLSIAGRFLFFLSSAYTINKIFPSENLYTPLLSLAIFPSFYGMGWIISYNEPFFTGRTLAEPLVILSIGFLIEAHKKAYLTSFCLAFVIHPLQSLPLAVFTCAHSIKSNKLKIAVISTAIIAGILFLKLFEGQPPFDIYDNLWLSWIDEPNKFVFLKNWETKDITYTGISLLVLIESKRLLTDNYNRVLTASITTGVLGLIFTLIFCDVAKSVLATSIQPWRGLWIMQWAAAIFTPLLIKNIYKESHDKALFLATAILLGTTSSSLISTPVAAVILIALYFSWNSVSPHVGKKIAALIRISIALSVVISSANYLTIVINNTAEATEIRIDSLILKSPLFLAMIFITTQIIIEKRAKPIKPVLIAIIIYSFITVDSRSDWTKSIEKNANLKPFTNIPRNGQVYWPGELLPIWLVLKKPSYLDDLQRAGLLFNRETAMEANERYETSSIIPLQLQICKIIEDHVKEKECQIDSKTIQEVCRSSKGIISNIIIPYEIDFPNREQWELTNSTGKVLNTYFSYQCKYE